MLYDTLAILGAVALVLILLGGLYANILTSVKTIQKDIQNLERTIGKFSHIIELGLADPKEEHQTEEEKEMELAPNDHVSIDMGNDIFPDLPIGTWSGPPITPRSGASSIQSNNASIITVIRAPGVPSSPRSVVSLEGFWGLTLADEDNSAANIHPSNPGDLETFTISPIVSGDNGPIAMMP